MGIYGSSYVTHRTRQFAIDEVYKMSECGRFMQKVCFRIIDILAYYNSIIKE